MIEPNPKGFKDIQKHRSGDQLFNYAVDLIEDTCSFRNSGATSSLSRDGGALSVVKTKPLQKIL